jgi:hypothetical protein
VNDQIVVGVDAPAASCGVKRLTTQKATASASVVQM